MPFFVVPLPTAEQVKKGAAKAKNVSVAGYNSAKGRYQSSSLGNGSGSTASSSKSPPPPPNRGASNASLYGPPPTRTASSSTAAEDTGSPPAAPARPPLPLRKQSSAGSPARTPLPPPPPRPPLPARTGSKSGSQSASPAPPAARPPLPQRSTSSASSQSSAPSPAPRLPSGPPPPIARHTRPDVAPPPPAPSFAHRAQAAVAPSVEIDSIDWVNLTPEDKRVFFSWLDEFFSRYLSSPVLPVGSVGLVNASGPRKSTPTPKPSVKVHSASSPAPPPAPVPRVHAPVPTQPAKGPPRVNIGTKPASASPASAEGMSYPPPTQHGSSALDLAYFFHPSTHWTEAWYATPNTLPPPLQNNGDIRWRGMTTSNGRERTFFAGVLFADLSMCWFSVSYSPTASNNTTAVRRHAEYLPRPAPLSGDALRAAHETYGEIVAQYAEGFAGTGRYCARGECWDLANEALKHAAQLVPGAPPVGSISRTHGHLVFAGTPRAGRWYGGDDRVRRGDILEWRRARVDLPGGAWATFGDPDHTAVITADAVPMRAPAHGGAIMASELVQLEVVEQGVGSPPVKKTYPLAGFVQGEMWIYRPVGMQAYVGAELAPTPPVGVRTVRL